MEWHSKMYWLIDLNSSVFYIYLGHSPHECKGSSSSRTQWHILQQFSSLILNSA